MAQIDQIVNIVITEQTSAVPTPSFSIPLIVGPTGFGNSDLIRYYSSASAMLTDGFTTSSIEYIYAVEAFEQALSPTLVGIGKRLAAVAQVDTLAVSTLVGTGHAYHFTLNGVLITYTSSSDTQQSILTALNAAIVSAFASPPVTGVVTGTGVSALLTLTAVTPGVAVTYTLIDSDLTHIQTFAPYGIASDLNAILQVSGGNNWYGLALCSNLTYDIAQAAAFIESAPSPKIFIAATADSGVPTTSVTDVASVLKGLGYKRTALMYSPVSAALGMDAAWLGGQLPQTPGASTWKFKSLIGIGPDVYTATQIVNMIGIPGTPGKNVNIYETVGGVNITQDGWMVGGQFIDITVFVDWLKVTMQTNIYSLLVNNPKVPYTDKGVGIVLNAVLQTLKQGSTDGGTGGLDATTIVTSVVPVANIPANTRAQRILPTNSIVWSARLTGALHYVVINGTVTV